jgi:ABC-type nickel/cobalt efflux system permease component RcnA
MRPGAGWANKPLRKCIDPGCDCEKKKSILQIWPALLIILVGLLMFWSLTKDMVKSRYYFD